MALLGAVAAVVGALVALLQDDIRRMLAWSTTSQMGLVFVAFGVGAYSAAIFQLIAHAWFKAVLVLGAASLASAYRTTLISEISGAWSRMRTTSVALLAGAASAAGLVLLAGFWSVSAVTAGILRNSLPGSRHVGTAAQVLVLIAVLATVLAGAIYPLRMLLDVARGELPRRRGFQPQRVREQGGRITTPLVLLAILAVLGGFVAIPQVRVSFGHFVFAGSAPQGESSAWVGLAIVAGLGLLGAALAWSMHTRRRGVPSLGRAGEVLAGGLRIEAAQDWLVEQALLRPAPLLARVDHEAEHRVLDEAGNALAMAAEAARRWQVGRVDLVTLSAIAGVALAGGAIVLGATGHLPFVGATR
jgi:NADH-quinone oxidoreductase subunit L